MRKLLAIFLAGLMLFGLLACGSDGTTSSTP
jgi:predicted small lipoprotein YifL